MRDALLFIAYMFCIEKILTFIEDLLLTRHKSMQFVYNNLLKLYKTTYFLVSVTVSSGKGWIQLKYFKAEL